MENTSLSDDSVTTTMDNKAEFLVTLRVNTFNFDHDNDQYTLSLNNCIASYSDDNKESVTLEIKDSSQVISFEKSRFISKDAGVKSLDDDQKMMEDIHIDKTENLVFTKRDKWFLLFWAIYIVAAICIFIVVEDDSFVDAFYFRIVTSFGVGFGDLYPVTATGKMLNCLFIVIDLAKLAYIDVCILYIYIYYV